MTSANAQALSALVIEKEKRNLTITNAGLEMLPKETGLMRTFPVMVEGVLTIAVPAEPAPSER